MHKKTTGLTYGTTIVVPYEAGRTSQNMLKYVIRRSSLHLLNRYQSVYHYPFVHFSPKWVSIG